MGKKSAAHVYLAVCLFGLFSLLLLLIGKPSEAPRALVWTLAISWMGSAVYLTWSLLEWFQEVTERKTEMLALRSEIEKFRQLFESRNNDCNREHMARRSLEVGIFNAIEALHASKRFKASTEAVEIRKGLEEMMLATLSPDSSLIAKIMELRQ